MCAINVKVCNISAISVRIMEFDLICVNKFQQIFGIVIIDSHLLLTLMYN